MFARLNLLLVAATLIIPNLDAQAPKQPRLDALGDPLPDGALARLGTLRYKHAPSGDPTIDLATFSPDGKRIASLVYGRGSVHIHDAGNGKEIPGAWKSLNGCTAFAFSPDGSMLAMTTNSNQVPQKMMKGKEAAKQEVISLFDIAGGKLAKALTGQSENIRALVFADGGKTLVSAGMGTIRWWEVATGKELRSWQPLAESKESAAGEAKKTKTFFNCVLAPDG
jgi:WD40 repeat protein